MPSRSEIESLSAAVAQAPAVLKIHLARAYVISGHPAPPEAEKKSDRPSRNPISAKNKKLNQAYANERELGAFFKAVLPGSDLIYELNGAPYHARVHITGEEQRETTDPDLWWIKFYGEHKASLEAAWLLAILASHEHWKRHTVTEDDIATYRDQGAIVVRQLFSTDEINLLKQGIAANMSFPSPLAIVASKPEDPGYFIEDFCNWQRFDAYKRFIFDTRAAEVAGRLMGAKEVRLYHDHLLVKEPKTVAKTPWHQDQPYYNIDGFLNISMWLPVDPVAKESSLRLVAGSHKEGWLMPRSFMNNEAKWFPEGSLKDLPDIDNNPDKFEILSWALEPGDAVFFHMLTLHGAGGVGNGNRRRVVSFRFMGEDTTHAPRKWRTSPPFPGLEERLPAGAKMQGDEFPLLWEK